MGKFKSTSAFSLIETIIAITVIGLVITAAASLTQGSLRIGHEAMTKLTAYHLAEEGLEIVRNTRDSNWMQNKKWKDGFSSNGLYVIAQNQAPFKLDFISSETAAEKIQLGISGVFNRYLQVEDGPDSSVRITSIVTYFDRGNPKKASLTTELTNWKKGPL